MIKVPVIDKRSGTQLSPKTGAVALDGQANLASFLAPSQAMQQSGENLLNTSLHFLEHEVKMKNATEVSAAEHKFNADIAQSANEAMEILGKLNPNFNADDLEKEFRTLAGFRFNNIRNGVVEGVTLSSSNAQREFGAKAATAINNQVLELRKWARKRQASRTIASTENDIVELEKKAANATTEIGRVEALTQIRKKAEFLVGLTHWDAEQANDAINNSYSTIDRMRAETELMHASQYEKDGFPHPERAFEVYNSLTEGKWKHLNVVDLTRLREEAINLQNTLIRLGNSEQDKHQRDAAKALKEKQRLASGEFRRRIVLSQSPEGAELPAIQSEEEVARTAPTVLELSDALSKNKITEDDYNKLITALSDDNVVVDNEWLGDQLKNLRVMVSDGITEQELEEWRESTLDGYPDKIGFEQYQQVEQYYSRHVGDTKEAKQIKIFGKLIDRMAGAKSILDNITGTSTRQRAALVSATYDGYIADGIPPLEAFQEASDQFFTETRFQLSSPEIRPNLPEDSKLMVDGSLRPLDTWTEDDLKVAEGEILESFQGTPSVLAIEIFKLEIIEAYLRNKPTDEELKAAKNAGLPDQ